MRARMEPKNERARWRLTRRGYPLVALALGLALTLAACAGEPSQTAQQSPTATGAPGVLATTSSATATTSTTATATPISGKGAQFGAQDICSQPTRVSAQPPATIPAYPGAELHASQADGPNGFYGYCTSASVDAIAQFYVQQLPGKGWQSVKTNTIANVQQVTATLDSTHLTVTVEPDSINAGEADILISAFAQQ